MKQLTCEMCGSTDLIKQDGVFVCQTCGCKYSIEEARKMMIEGTVEVTGTVKVDNTAAIANYLQMANSALEASNHKEAEEYANKIIELDPTHAEAWVIKGEAAGWQSTNSNPRLSDAVTAFLNGIKYTADADKGEVRQKVANKYTSLMLAMISLRCKNFGTFHNAEHQKNVLSELDNCVTFMNRLMTEGGVSFNRAYTYDQITKEINQGAVAGYQDAKNDFGPEHHNMAKWQWERFTASCDACIAILEEALNYAKSNDRIKTIYDNLVVIGVAARDSCSWKFNVNSWAADHYDKDYSFTKKAKETRTKNIDRWKGNKEGINSNAEKKKALLDAIQGKRVEAEAALGRKQYWAEHAAEKEALDSEYASLDQRKQKLAAELQGLPILAEIEQKKAKIEELDKTRSGLGLFKGKEKKALQEQIDSEQQQLNGMESQLKQLQEPFMKEDETIQARMEEIRGELTKDRGRVSVSAGRAILEGAVKDGQFTVTPNMILDHFSKTLATDQRQPQIEEAKITPFSEFGKVWELKFINPLNENKQTGSSIYLYAETKDAPFSAIAIPVARKETAEIDFCTAGTDIILALSEDKELSRDAVENGLCDIIWDTKRSLYVIDQFRVEFATYTTRILGVGLVGRFGIIRVND